MVIEGEPGIGKSRLLLELTQIAASEHCVVLAARASEFERDLPFALWGDAIDGHLRELGERQVRLLGVADPHALAAMVEDRAARIGLSPISRDEAEQLVGMDVATIYPLSGGNPFYLQQLARVPAHPAAARPRGMGPVPVAVAASVAVRVELGRLQEGV